jgi:hypothetical protein
MAGEALSCSIMYPLPDICEIGGNLYVYTRVRLVALYILSKYPFRYRHKSKARTTLPKQSWHTR